MECLICQFAIYWNFQSLVAAPLITSAKKNVLQEHILPLFEAEQSDHYVIGTISAGQGQIIIK
ncbi:hypothetical protein KY46_04930 [Photobacterium halotolerans]|uniref:Uncharacterized protein n=1 Tax=Photobacterium halotolerans TaxID=265726 RepID=A0A0F5VGC9_9GAMM|nr:hypothetical protein KY46_04930 [Photobacterium halotolerans]